MLSKLYDNIDDATSKLTGTIVYYDNQPVVVKQVGWDENDPNYVKNASFCLYLTKSLASHRGSYNVVPLRDPKLNYTRYNLGYANYNGTPVWWYRIPVKQYRQGLKNDQVANKCATPFFEAPFTPTKALEAMLKVEYPSLREAIELVQENPDDGYAFHPDVAVRWDKIHEDILIEYKGAVIGCTDIKFNNIKLIDQNRHLVEVVSEAINGR